MEREFVVKNIKYPEKGSIDRDIEWFCKALGISGSRDKNRVAVSIFKLLLKKREMSEEMLAKKLHVSRTTISHHMEKMIKSGLVMKRKGIYYMSGNSLEEMLEDMKSEIFSSIERIKKIAREIDREFRLRGRV